MRHPVLATAWLASVGVLLCVGHAEAQISRALVKAEGGRVYSQADTSSVVTAALPRWTGVDFQEREVCDEAQEWCAVFARSITMRPRGWMRKSDLFVSKGVARFWDQKYEDALESLQGEIREADEEMPSTWLRFFVGYSQWRLGRFDQADATFEQTTRQRGPVTLIPLAYRAAAALHGERQDFTGQLRWYDALLAAFPDYQTAFADCSRNPVKAYWNLCGDDLAARIDAIRTFAAVQTTARRIITDTSVTPTEQAAAWYSLGQGWERKNSIDPDRSDETDDDARRCYEGAVKAAPASEPAGNAAWRLIALSEPREWEGDVAAEADWVFQSYGAFVRAHPRHPLVGEAKFHLAIATWANVGYPELFGYIDSAGTWDDWHNQQRYLDQWFDARGFGGGVGAIPPIPRPKETVKALRLFREIVRKYPKTVSAAVAQYYSAVILDYCLRDAKNALVEYRAFLKNFPNTEPYEAKATKRIASLGSVK